jgi:UDPglucose 6-dehydrogenase
MKPTSRVAIIGGGTVGGAMAELFGGGAVVYDIRPGFSHDRSSVNHCQASFVCVPTPRGDDGAADTSVVEDVVSWLETPLVVIRSTVPPGTTDRLRRETAKHVVFQPEYLGETPRHVYRNLSEQDFIVLGGPLEDTSAVADIYKRYLNATVRYHFCDAKTAELAKYMENAFFAAKVTFVNEFHDIARLFGVDFNLLREIWLADGRINPDHTDVYPSARGFCGKCLPKDLDAIIAACLQGGYDPKLLTAVRETNNQWTRQTGTDQRILQWSHRPL